MLRRREAVDLGLRGWAVITVDTESEAGQTRRRVDDHVRRYRTVSRLLGCIHMIEQAHPAEEGPAYACPDEKGILAGDYARQLLASGFDIAINRRLDIGETLRIFRGYRRELFARLRGGAFENIERDAAMVKQKGIFPDDLGFARSLQIIGTG